MNVFSLIFIIFSFIFVIESGKIRLNFDEIFGEEWDKNKREENSEENGTESIDQMQNDHNISKSDQNSREDPNDQQKIKMIQKFEAIKEKLKQKGKFQNKDRNKIERKIGKLLSVGRHKIYKWKKELNLNKKKIMKKNFYGEKKRNFIDRCDEFKDLYAQGKQKVFVKELGISQKKFWKWKKELVPKYHKTPTKYSNEDQSMKMKQYFEIKERNPKIRDKIIFKKLEVGYKR